MEDGNYCPITLGTVFKLIQTNLHLSEYLNSSSRNYQAKIFAPVGYNCLGHTSGFLRTGCRCRSHPPLSDRAFHPDYRSFYWATQLLTLFDTSSSFHHKQASLGSYRWYCTHRPPKLFLGCNWYVKNIF